MRSIILFLLCCLTAPAFGGEIAYWADRAYTLNPALASGSVTYFPRAKTCGCEMCQSLRAQWATPDVAVAATPVAEDGYEVIETQEPIVKKICHGTWCEYKVVGYRTVQKRVPVAKKVVEPEVKIDPTPQVLVDVMVALLKMDEDSVFYDLGAGDGRIVLAAAKAGWQAYGIELDKSLAAKAHNQVKPHGGTVYHGDILKSDLKKATHVAMYLHYDLMEEVVPRLMPGTRIVSYAHEIPGLKNEKFVVGERELFVATIPPLAM